MRQVHKPKGWVHWTGKIEEQVHFFVKILEHKINMLLLI